MWYAYNLVASFWKEGSASGSGNDNISDVECPGRIIAVDKLKAAITKKKQYSSAAHECFDV